MKLRKVLSTIIALVMVFMLLPATAPTTMETATITQIYLGYNVDGYVTHPEKPIVYTIDSANKKIHSYNYITEDRKESLLDYSPNNISILNGEIYLSLQKRDHSYDWITGQEGAIAIFNASTLVKIQQFDIDLDPWDMKVDNRGFMYVTSGSGQWQNIKCYSRESEKEVSSIWGIWQGTDIEIHPIFNRVYAEETYSSPGKYNSYNFEYLYNADKTSQFPSFTGGYSSTRVYNELGNFFKISPDGKYIFNETGAVYSCSIYKEKDMKYYKTLNKKFKDIAFNIEKDKFYTAVDNKSIYEYIYSSMKGINTYYTINNIKYIMCQGENLLAITKDNDGKNYLEIIKQSPIATITPAITISSTPTPIQTQIPVATQYVALDYNVDDSVLDPNNSIIYSVDNANKKIHSYNYGTGEKKEKSLDLLPNNISIYNGELYVSLSKYPHEENYYNIQVGAIEIFNASTLEIVDQISVNLDPCEMEVDKNGYIYVSSTSGQYNKVQCYSRTTKQETSLGSYKTPNIEIDPVNNRLYFYIIKEFGGNKVLYARDISYTEDNDHPLFKNSDSNEQYYYTSQNFKVSPDGKYIFNFHGEVYKYSAGNTPDIQYDRLLTNAYSDITFDIDNDRIFTSVNNNQIYEYTYSGLKGTNSYNIRNKANSLVYQGGNIFAITKSNTNKYYLEIIKPLTLTPTPAPTPTPTATPINSEPVPVYTSYKSLGYKADDSVIDPDRPVIYSIDKTRNSVHSYDYSTGEQKEKSLNYQPNNISIFDGEIYVSLTNVNTGFIYILDASTLEIKDQINTDILPYWMVVDRQKNIYITESTRYNPTMYSYSRISKQGSKFLNYIDEYSIVMFNPVYDRLYLYTSNLVNSYNITYDVNTGRPVVAGAYSHSQSYWTFSGKSKFSPDGNYLFNIYGSILKGDENPNNDMMYFNNMKIYTDIDFDIQNNRFFTAVDNNINEYKYPEMTEKNHYATVNSVKTLMYHKGKIIAITANIANNYYMEVIEPEVPTPTETQTAAATPTVTITPLPSPTSTPSPTATIVPTLTNTPVPTQTLKPTTTVDATPLVTFPDVNENNFSWAINEIQTLATIGIISGKTDSGGSIIYDPAAKITRAELTKLIVQSFNIDGRGSDASFSDVSRSSWYYQYIGAAYKHGIIKGTSDTTFEPDSPITRQDMTSIIIRAMARYDGITTISDYEVNIKLSGFADSGDIADYAKAYVATAVYLNIIRGTNDDGSLKFKPKDNTNRAEAAVVIYRMLNEK